MIVGTGIDIVELARIRKAYERYGQKFLMHFLSESELEQAPQNLFPWLGGRFAAKEAASKALGTGFSEGIIPQDFLIFSQDRGRPRLQLAGRAKLRAIEMAVRNVHLSISHERQYAIAEVILEN